VGNFVTEMLQEVAVTGKPREFQFLPAAAEVQPGSGR
jgi:hypothetical protein